MSRDDSRITILMADDDPDDRMMAKRAIERNGIRNELRFVEDGEELLEYLTHTGRYQDATNAPLPGLILLDLNMPRLSGREALAIIKQNPTLKHIPVVILTTSEDEADVLKSYQLGANSFVTKPVTFEGLVDAMRGLGLFWLDIVKLPADPRSLPPVR